MEKSHKKKSALVFASTLVVLGTGAVILFRFLELDTARLRESFSRFHLGVILFAGLAAFLQILCQANRLWALFGRGTLPWFQILRSFCYGQFLNAFVPARAGDLMKAFLLQRKDPSSGRPIEIFESAGVIIADKFTDIISLLTLILIALGLRATILRDVFQGISPLELIYFLATASAVLLVLWYLSRKFSKALWLKKFLSGLASVKSPWRLSGSWLWALGAWLFEMLIILILCSALSKPLSFSEIVWILAVLNLGIAVPISFANVGTFEAAMTFALTRVGFTLPEALSIATVHHLIQALALCLSSLGIYLGSSRIN